MTWFGKGRDNGQTGGEFSAILYDSTWFERLDGKTFWLSSTPDVPGVRGWDAACPRVVTWMLLKNRETGNRFYIINTHFDHQGETARRESARIVSDLAKEMQAKHPVILLGDFNANPESDVIRTISANSGLAEASTRVENYQPTTECTYTGFDGKDCEHIDFIWVSQNIKVESYQIIDNNNGFNRLSDHRPVKALLAL
ncbi:MAG: endonuclease/exonuclease/phosphatase family protein [Bacteroidales bacterium]